MGSSQVPAVAAALPVVRIKEGGELSAVVAGPGVPINVHWSGSRSVPCTAIAGDCVGCSRNRTPQWQAFFPVRADDGRMSLLLLGARSLTMGRVESVHELTGRACSFVRPKGRRFVMVQPELERGDVAAFDAIPQVALLFGVVSTLPPDGDDRIERAYWAKFRDQIVRTVTSEAQACSQ